MNQSMRKSSNVPLTIPDRLYKVAMEQGRETQDTVFICAVLEKTAGLPERK